MLLLTFNTVSQHHLQTMLDKTIYFSQTERDPDGGRFQHQDSHDERSSPEHQEGLKEGKGAPQEAHKGLSG